MPAPPRATGLRELLPGPLGGQLVAGANVQLPKNGRPSGPGTVPTGARRSAFRMTIAWMSFPYTSSSVPSSPPGSWWSIARSVVQTCGHLNFGFTALTSNDCWSVEESPGDPVGRSGPAGNKFGLAPGFESTFPIHTNGTRPVKMPVPPRTWVRRSPEAFQLKPRRGDHSAAAFGSLLWSTISGLPFASSAVKPRENGLSTGFVKYIGKSTRRPYVRFNRSVTGYSSWR